MSEIKGELLESYAVLSESPKGNTTTELCKVSWNGRDGKIEIRKMDRHTDPENIKWMKGLALSDDELNILAETLIELGYGNIDVLHDYVNSRYTLEED